MDKTYARFLTLDLDLSPVGFTHRGSFIPYYCTPENAQILGRAGVDGIHYCTIPLFGEMIFAVSPMNFGDCVHPIARNFTDLLRLLLACVDMAALEQCFAWDEAQFHAFLADNPATPEQQAALDSIRGAFSLSAMESPYAYIRQLQSEFDLSRIPYTEDYLDPDMNPAAPAPLPCWNVVFGGFWAAGSACGEELPVKKSFLWGDARWHIPAVYLFPEGIVVDFLLQADGTKVRAFLEQVEACNDIVIDSTRQAELDRQNPLDVDFTADITLNGEALSCAEGSGIFWLPPDCIAQGDQPDPLAAAALAHYELDPDCGWAIHRCCYRWAARPKTLQAMSVRMVRDRQSFFTSPFPTPAQGESVLLRHPLTRQEFTLTVQNVEQGELAQDAFADPSLLFPTHYMQMIYTLTPDIHGAWFSVQDSAESDHPRPKQTPSNAAGPAATSCAAVIGVIGGADGPAAFTVAGRDGGKSRSACSSLRFSPPEKVLWHGIFREKTAEDITVRII